MHERGQGAKTKFGSPGKVHSMALQGMFAGLLRQNCLGSPGEGLYGALRGLLGGLPNFGLN